jgi:hypothetical protein
MSKLIRAQEGDAEEGLVFTGGGVERITDIPTVAALMERLQREFELGAREVLA